MPPTNEHPWYTARECAAALKMSLRTFKRYVGAGVFPKGLRGGKWWTADDLAWMRQTVLLDARLGMIAKVWEEGEGE